MSRFTYEKYTPNLSGELDLEALLDRLRNFFLQSGFLSQFYPDDVAEPTRQNLKQLLADLLSEHEQLPEHWRDELKRYAENPLNFQLSPEVDEFLEQILERLVNEGYLEQEGPNQGEGRTDEGKPSEVRFQLTEKSIDFLGYRRLRELMGSLGGAELGKHRSDSLATGVEVNAGSRPYRFGDTLNLDVGATLLEALQREGLGVPLNMEYSDLMVHQTEKRSSCATVLMLDCSHSMILYGEDRFTPAKTVALALAHLIRTQFPGDSLEVILFHDSAERIPLRRLPAVQVGPFHTNTCAGLSLARRILMSQSKEMRQIIMITDGKPSALTLPDGRIYKNAWGLDPFILDRTYEEVARCRKARILINTFMLARDFQLVNFVKRVSQICRGKAYFTTSVSLEDYVLMDYMKNRSKRVH